MGTKLETREAWNLLLRIHLPYDLDFRDFTGGPLILHEILAARRN